MMELLDIYNVCGCVCGVWRFVMCIRFLDKEIASGEIRKCEWEGRAFLVD